MVVYTFSTCEGAVWNENRHVNDLLPVRLLRSKSLVRVSLELIEGTDLTRLAIFFSLAT